MSFEHLDDPAGFDPDDELRAAVREDGRRRRTRRRAVLAGGSVLTSVAVLVAALAGFGLWRTTRIDRVDVEFAAPPVDLVEPFNVLLVGSDSREGSDDPGAQDVVGARSDTMIVARVEPTERRVVLLSLPRDLAVVPRVDGTQQRLNTAFEAGGADGLVDAVESRLGIPVSAYVQVDFEGLVRLVDAVGGLPLSVSATVRDQSTGLWLEPAECTTVDGSTALALLRSRHLESLGEDGRWISDPSSDLGRMSRQQAVIAALLPELGRLADGLGGWQTAIGVAGEHLTVDSRLSDARLLSLARWFVAGDTPEVQRVSLPVTAVDIGGASMLALGSGADEAVAEVGGSLPSATEVPPARVGDVVGPTSDDVVGVIPVGPCP